MRVQGLREHGAASVTIRPVLADGDLIRIGRGLHQNLEAEIDSDLTPAGIAKRIPKGVIAMTSALAWHGRTDQNRSEPGSHWLPARGYPHVRIMRFVNIASLKLTPIELGRLINEIQALIAAGCTGFAKG